MPEECRYFDSCSVRNPNDGAGCRVYEFYSRCCEFSRRNLIDSFVGSSGSLDSAFMTLEEGRGEDRKIIVSPNMLKDLSGSNNFL